MIAPPLYPYTGSKRLLADTIWPLLGSPGHYIEPFAGSAAVLLARPGGHCGTETINDADGLIANVWRAIRLRSDAVLDAIMESPASCEVDVHAHHIRLIKARDALVPRLQGDPDYCDPRLAGWWIRGACEWIGTGWCAQEGPWDLSTDDEGYPILTKIESVRNPGIRRKLPHLGNAGKGVNRPGVKRKLPHLGDPGTGVNRPISQGDYEQRKEYIRGMLYKIRDRLVDVRIVCGDWNRVLTPSVMRAGKPVAVYLDPPYDMSSTRNNKLDHIYGAISVEDHISITSSVREWCIKISRDKPDITIVLSGRGEEHDELLHIPGWEAIKNLKVLHGYNQKPEEGTHCKEGLWIYNRRDGAL